MAAANAALGSKEQYDLLTSVVRHFLPDASLNKESLREIVAQLPTNSAGVLNHPGNRLAALPNGSFECERPEVIRPPPTGRSPVSSSPNLSAETQATSALSSHEAGHAQDASHSASPQVQRESMRAIIPTSVTTPNGNTHNHSQPSSNDRSKPSPIGSVEHNARTSSGASCASETFPVESVLRRDVMDITRYDSGTSWPSFFTKIHATVGYQHSNLSANTPSLLDVFGSSKQVDLISADDLPPRAVFERAASQFFTEINCVSYILSYEEYNAYTAKAFEQKGGLSHSVFMLLCLILSLDKEYEHYFSRACEHFEHALEEGSLASVEALMLLTLCRLNRDQRNLAWISMGCAFRIAQTLGLHLNESHWEEKSQPMIENRRRLWWSLYDSEVCLAYRLGRSVGIDLASCEVGMPSETVFSLTPNCPPDYHTAVSQLSKITGLIVQDLYGTRSAVICLDSRADELIGDLQRFWQDVPSHLKPDAPMASCHARAVLYLGLRYDYAVLLATRPSIVSCWKYPGACSSKLMQRVETFVAANKRSLLLLKRMAQGDLLSRQNHLDASYILANILTFTLRIFKDPSLELLNEAAEYRRILALTQHLAIGRTSMRTFEATIDEVRSMLNLQEQLQEADSMSIDDFWQGVMDVNGCIWPTWPSDGAVNV